MVVDDRLLDDGWHYNEARKELYCPHNVGHPLPSNQNTVHGCDGCCSINKESDQNKHSWKKNLEIVRSQIKKNSAKELFTEEQEEGEE